jgi:hypothetical protein
VTESDRDLRELEKRTFRAATDDGLWDVLVAAFFAMFAVAPLLSESLGDFWSSAVFLPVWIAVYLIVHSVRRRVIAPRVGTVRFGQERMRQLRRFALMMLGINVIAMVLGLIVAIGVRSGWLDLGTGGVGYPVVLGVVGLAGFTLAAYAMSIPRYYLYGLMLAIAPIIGEWLWRNDLASHHGYPIVFGGAAGVILITGLVRLGIQLRSHPLHSDPVGV